MAARHAAFRLRVAVAFFVALLGAPVAAEDELPPGYDYLDPLVVDFVHVDAARPYPSRVTLQGELLGSYGYIEIAVIRPDGRARKLDRELIKVADSVFTAEVPLNEGRGVYRVEISATNRDRLTHSALRVRFFAGVPADTPDPPPPPDDPEPPDVADLMLEARLFAKVNAHRARAKLEPFEWLEPLAVVARNHAADCARLGRHDHHVNAEGNLARRLVSTWQWPRVSYATPYTKPSRDPDATDYVGAVTAKWRSLDRMLYRWKRFAAFAVPMTSERMTHVACGVARDGKGSLFVVFAYAQINNQRARLLVESLYRDLLRRAKRARDPSVKAVLLRELGRWRRREGAAQAKSLAKSAAPEIRAAAWDVLRLIDEEKATSRLEGLLARRRQDVEQGRRSAETLADVEWLARLETWPTGVAAALALRADLETAAAGALEAAQARLDAADPAAGKRALRALIRAYPGTPAAKKARDLLGEH